MKLYLKEKKCKSDFYNIVFSVSSHVVQQVVPPVSLCVVAFHPLSHMSCIEKMSRVFISLLVFSCHMRSLKRP